MCERELGLESGLRETLQEEAESARGSRVCKRKPSLQEEAESARGSRVCKKKPSLQRVEADRVCESKPTGRGRLESWTREFEGAQVFPGI